MYLRKENTGEEKRGKRACDVMVLPPSTQPLWLDLQIVGRNLGIEDADGEGFEGSEKHVVGN